MISFACMNFGELGIAFLIIGGIALAIGMAVTGLVALLMSRLVEASLRKMLVVEAAVFSLVAGVAYLLNLPWEGTLALSLLGAISSVILIMATGLYGLVRGKASVSSGQKFCSLELADRPTEF